MTPAKKIVYAGESFWLQTSGRYYQSRRPNAEEKLLHRRIYTDHFGPIPSGYQIHHANGDWQDNTPQNLVLVARSEHARQHLAERMATPEGLARAQEGLLKAQKAAKAWHASAEGAAWHAHHSREQW